MKIWVDADACPSEIKDIIIKAAVRLNLPLIFVANKPIKYPPYPNISSIVVGKGFDVADQHIVDSSNTGDLCISQDIPLASELIKKGITVIDLRGETLNEASIGQRLSIRNFMDQLRGAGVQTGGPRQMDQRSKQNFSSAFDRELTRLHRQFMEKQAREQT